MRQKKFTACIPTGIALQAAHLLSYFEKISDLPKQIASNEVAGPADAVLLRILYPDGRTALQYYKAFLIEAMHLEEFYFKKTPNCSFLEGVDDYFYCSHCYYWSIRFYFNRSKQTFEARSLLAVLNGSCRKNYTPTFLGKEIHQHRGSWQNYSANVVNTDSLY